MRLLLKQAIIVEPSVAESISRQDILIENQVITRIAPTITGIDAEIIESPDLCVSAGWIDMNTKLCEPGFEKADDIQSLCASARAGGFTQVVALPNTNPTVHTKATVQFIREKSKQYGVELLPMACATIGAAGEEMSELYDLHAAGAVAFGDGIIPINQPELIKNILLYLKPFGGLFINRAEERSMSRFGQINEGRISTFIGMAGIPTLAEELALLRDIALVEYTQGRIHFSGISSARGVQLIREAKQKGLSITADVTVHNLFFTEDALLDFDTNIKLNPPLRTEADRLALWEGLTDGTIDVIVSAHIPHDIESKRLEFDYAEFGALSLESCWGALLASKPMWVSWQTIVEKITTAPRRILNLPQPKIAENTPANLTVFDKSLSWEFKITDIYSKSINSPYINKILVGKPLKTIINHNI